MNLIWYIRIDGNQKDCDVFDNFGKESFYTCMNYKPCRGLFYFSYDAKQVFFICIQTYTNNHLKRRLDKWF